MTTRKSVLISTIGIAFALSMGALHARHSERHADPMAENEMAQAGAMKRVSAVVTDRSKVTPGLSRSEFERELSEKFLGTHQLYQMLTEEAKGEVYGYYQDDNDIASIRRAVAYSM